MLYLFGSVAALALDAIVGDPRWLPHPVRWMGKLILWCETVLYPRKRSALRESIGGILTVLIVSFITVATGYLFLIVCGKVHPFTEIGATVVIGFYCLSMRSLMQETERVRKLLAAQKIDEARNAVAMIVGRDTGTLDEYEISRATVETIAESIVDGIVSPLFYLVTGGPLAALLFKAVSTMDSMIGYRNERYRYFGTFAARCDDILNFIPARITAFILFPLAAVLAGKHPVKVLKAVIADRRKHPSPNSAHGEAAMAGALGVRLGGVSTYGGLPSEKPVLNNAGRKPEYGDIASANGLTVALTGVAVVIFVFIRIMIYHYLQV